jgi:hypothetical protein
MHEPFNPKELYFSYLIFQVRKVSIKLINMFKFYTSSM